MMMLSSGNSTSSKAALARRRSQYFGTTDDDNSNDDDDDDGLLMKQMLNAMKKINLKECSVIKRKDCELHRHLQSKVWIVKAQIRSTNTLCMQQCLT